MNAPAFDESTLASQQARVLAFIREHTAQHGYPPTLTEICREMGWASKNAAIYPLRRLAMKGLLIDGGWNQSRRYRLPESLAPEPPRTSGADLSPRQAEIVRYLHESLRSGASPSFADIAGHFGWSSPHSVTWHLDTLERKGYVRRVPNQPRAIAVLKLPVEAEPCA